MPAQEGNFICDDLLESRTEVGGEMTEWVATQLAARCLPGCLSRQLHRRCGVLVADTDQERHGQLFGTPAGAVPQQRKQYPGSKRVAPGWRRGSEHIAPHPRVGVGEYCEFVGTAHRGYQVGRAAEPAPEHIPDRGCEEPACHPTGARAVPATFNTNPWNLRHNRRDLRVLRGN